MTSFLSDYHHSDLAHSLALLLEDRFNFKLYFPVGMDYFDQEYWEFEKIVHGNEIAKQYLSPWATDRDCGDHFERDDWQHPGRVLKLLTLEQTRAMRPEVVLATVQHNEVGFYRLAKEIGAKLGLQLGNQGSTNRFDLADFAMLSTTRPEKSFPCPVVYYHQEFDTNLFSPHYPPEEKDTCCTWVQVLIASSGEQERFDCLAKMTPELRWYTHGHDIRNPYFRENIKDTPAVARSMQAARVGIHFKTWSDGAGHVVHNLFAIGKPCLVTASYYLGTSNDKFPKMAGTLMEDGVTCFDVQAHTNEEAAAFIRRLVNDEDYYQRFSERVYARFKQCVDFDSDAEKVKKMLLGIL